MICHGGGQVRFAIVGGDSSLANAYIPKLVFIRSYLSPI